MEHPEQRRARIERERAKLERERDDARSLVAALVLQYGERVATGHRRAGLASSVLDRATGASLSVHMDPDSGAVLLHVREA